MNPTPSPDSEAHHPRALSQSSDSPPPQRGEVFEVALDENGQIADKTAGEEGPPRRAASWFFAGLAALFCVYNLGAYVGQKSQIPAPIGPFVAKTEKLRALRVQIAGHVKKPGVYSLPGGARIEDALKVAGGALPDGDTTSLNLADWAVDGSKIEVPARQTRKTRVVAPTPTPVVIIKEVFVTPPQNESATQSKGMPDANLDELALQSPAKIDTTPKSAPKKPKTSGKSAPAALALLKRNPIDLNTGSADQLAALPGVGPKMAERIIVYRRENGPFKSIADLDNVKGIGEKRMAVLQNLVKIK